MDRSTLYCGIIKKFPVPQFLKFVYTWTIWNLNIYIKNSEFSVLPSLKYIKVKQCYEDLQLHLQEINSATKTYNYIYTRDAQCLVTFDWLMINILPNHYKYYIMWITVNLLMTTNLSREKVNHWTSNRTIIILRRDTEKINRNNLKLSSHSDPP